MYLLYFPSRGEYLYSMTDVSLTRNRDVAMRASKDTMRKIREFFCLFTTDVMVILY